MIKSQPLRVAAIGCGGWGKNIVRTLARMGALAAVVDPSEAGRAAAASLSPGTPVHADLNAVLDDDSIPGVMIATPAETHFAVARRCLEAGKDVFVEKPLTIDVAESVELVALARRLGRVLMVGHLLEYHPAVLKLRELIDAGELGSVRYIISNRLNLGKIRTEENALWSFAPHDIAVIRRLIGEDPIQVVATGGSYVSANIADTTVTQLLFSNGARSHVFVSWLHPFKEQRLVVVGSKKMASFDDVNKELVLFDQRVDWQEGQPVPVKGEGVRVDYGDAEPLMAECEHFIACIRERTRPRTDGESGVRVLEILHAAQRSMQMNGQPVAIAPAALHDASEGAPIVEVKPGRLTHAVR